MQEIYKDDEQKSNNLEHTVFRTNIHRPIFRFMDIVFLLCLALTLIDEWDDVSDKDRKKQIHHYDIITAVLVVTWWRAS